MKVKYVQYLVLNLATILLVQMHHKEMLNRSATTFTIPFTAFLLFTNVLVNSAIVNEQNVNTKQLRIYTIPLVVNKISPNHIIPSTINKAHTIIEYTKLANNN